eukprot:2453186-Rhodomonas_salina.1
MPYPATCIRACYAMSGTGHERAVAISGTDCAYAATRGHSDQSRRASRYRIGLCACYAMSGTKLREASQADAFAERGTERAYGANRICRTLSGSVPPCLVWPAQCPVRV